MKFVRYLSGFAAWLAIVVASANITATVALAIDEGCLDDPDGCAGPRSWALDFDEELEFDDDGFGIGAAEGWQRRNGTSAEPFYEDGKAIFDGTIASWTLIDTMDHFFEGETTIHVQMDANPGEELDKGAGWWVNADNEGNQGGMYPIYGVLARNDEGEQEYQFGPDSVTDEFVPVEEGPIDVMVTLIPDEGNEEMVISYAITDAVETHTGDFTIVARDGAGSPSDDKWFTLFSLSTGQGVFEHVEVQNQPAPSLPGDFDGDGQLTTADIDDLTARSAGKQNPVEYDLNGDALVNELDIRVWAKDLFGTWIGDSDLDGEFNSGDLVRMLASGTYEVDVDSVWTQGDFNGDGRTDSGDLVAGLADGGYENGPVPAAVASVPEPTSFVLALMGLAAFGLLRNRRE